jgi:ketosteroid isomerase-like protein
MPKIKVLSFHPKPQPMPSELNKQIALRWFGAFNTHNLEALLALYHDDAQHYSPKLKIRHPQTKGLIKGKAALREWWQDAFSRLPSLRYEMLALTADKGQVFMEYLRHVDGEEDMRVAELLVIEEDKIIASRVYHG